MIVTVKVSGDIPPTGAEYTARWNDLALNHMQVDVVEPVASIAQQLAPTGITAGAGAYKSSITGDVTNPKPGLVIGQVFSTDEQIKAQVIEGVDASGVEQQYGRKPGTFPNLDAMIELASAVTGATGSELDHIAFLFGSKIKRDGIPAVRPIKLAVEMKQPMIDEIFSTRILNELAA